MTLFTGSGSIPMHQYVWVSRRFVRKYGDGYEPAIWFGLQCTPSRSFGLHVRLDDGAIVRNLPPHSIRWYVDKDIEPKSWIIEDAQRWDCTGDQFAIHEYDYLREMKCYIRDVLDRDIAGTYMFTVIPMRDGYTRTPEQAKEYLFIRTDDGTLAIRPTNMVLVIDDSQKFIDKPVWPKDIKPQTEIWHAED